MTTSPSTRLRRTAALLVLAALAACGERGAEDETPGGRESAGVEVLGMKPGMTRTEYLASLRDLLGADSGAVARQTVAVQEGGAWTMEARVMASHEDPARRQVLIVGRREG